MKKLKWYKDTDFGQTEVAVYEAPVWRAEYCGKEGIFDLEVYPLKLINKNSEGWEYRIIEDNGKGTGEEYDALLESSVGNDHAPTAEKAMKWAELTLNEMLEERREKRKSQKAKA